MRFGKTLRSNIYPQWKDQYVDYSKLKSLLREDEDNPTWTEDDENKFCEEMFNVQLDKVAAFQESTFKELEARTDSAAEKLKDLAPEDGNAKGELTMGRFKEVESELDEIINETKELKKFSNINYTGFLKIVKKHDRKRGNNYKIRPMMMNNLSRRPFNSEQSYSPLLNKLSMMYYAVRQQLDETESTPAASSLDVQSQIQNGERYTAHKFWVHPDNLLEVKTFILRRLPVLVYSEQAAKELEGRGDPTINSLYFDNPEFSLYNQKVERQVNASSLRIRWFGQLSTKPELVIERKIIHENGTSEEKRFPIKEKYIQPFIKGEYKMEKSVQKMERQGQSAAKVEEFKNTVADIQKFIQEKELQPILRANYTRTAFQKPLDDKVRISIDTHLAFVREDAIDPDRPCRNPEDWHRHDIDNGNMVYPFSDINKGEVNRFPFSVLEIKVKDDGRKYSQWVEELIASHLVHKAPRFSKFVHGVASLFEDNVNNLPFWLSELESDIRKDPQAAFEEEEERKAKKAENELVVGSLLGTSKHKGSYSAAVSSPRGKSYMQERMAAEERAGRKSDFGQSKSQAQASDETNGENGNSGSYGTMASIFPSFSQSRYAKKQREKVKLPEGVTKPTQLIKDSGPLKVEPKVWLANERTFLKWLHISVLISTLALAMFNASKNSTTRGLAIAFLCVGVFTCGWAYLQHKVRREMIIARSGKDFDNMIGPLVVGFSVIAILIINYGIKVATVLEARENRNASMAFAQDVVGKLELL